MVTSFFFFFTGSVELFSSENTFIICDFMLLVNFKDPKISYLIDDSCIIDVELDVIAIKIRNVNIE